MHSPHAHQTFAGITVSDDGLDTGEAEFNQRPELQNHLGWATFLELAREPARVVVIDHTVARREMTAGQLLAVGCALARRWRRSIAARRVGVVLPPGIGAFVANIALTFAGKVPVNLNFTAGRTAVAAAMRKAGVETIISAQALREKVADFPWPEKMLDVRAEIGACGKAAIAGWLAAIRVLPPAFVARRARVPRRGGDEEAALLFTSGSAGEPKGVALTHRNIIGNCRQTRETGLLRPGETMIGCLPVFHSFGFTVTMWYPMLHRMTVATFPSPLETRRLAEIIAAERAEVLIGAPTFLRPFLKRADPEQMRSLRTVVAGAEKMPRDLYDAFMQRFGLPIREGYGLTETTPVLAINRPDPVPLAAGGEGAGHRLGSVGLVVPGMRARVVDLETLEPRPRGETGVLAVRGCNVFGGYLDEPAVNAAVLRDGWFVTGDLARIDDDGFLYIEGRVSRFSKIAGEMVPHITVEQKIIASFGWEGAEAQPVVVVGVPDETKGEVLIALTTHNLATDAMRAKLSEAGLPNLWIPKRVLQVERIPTLNTGKLDLRGCRRLAEESDCRAGGQPR
jgi:acyl-[acyl-carrier-protein]-phospholipid O-acyltransferase / long-chain-fatty-acid--[acyl-carrier-protein] ligase